MSACKSCHGEGTVGTGIDESPSTLCNACDGTGYEPIPGEANDNTPSAPSALEHV